MGQTGGSLQIGAGLKSSGIDLDAYLDRIGYGGERTPRLETLAAIHLRHAITIPFENLDPFLGRPVRLDLASLEQKLVRDRRGGYCFEQNLLFGQALKQTGFEVKGLGARVMWNAPDDSIRPRSHMLLLVKVEGKEYVADAGFGGTTLTGPLRLEPDVEQTTPHEPFRLVSIGDEFVMEANIGEAWKPLYRFDLREHYEADYEVSSWYLSHHPESQFVTGLRVGRPDRDRRYAMLNNELAIHHLGGPTERRSLTPTQLRATLEDVFQINLTNVPELDTALAGRW